MKVRTTAGARACALAGLGAALVLGAPASSHPGFRADSAPMLRCPPAGPSTIAPPLPPHPLDPTACRARPSRVLESGTAAPARPVAGYQHLGAGTAGDFSGVSGRLSVTDPAVRAGTYDFLAARFMAKRQGPDGHVTWLEAGWAETGWSGDGRQRVYTYDTARGGWRFYDAYRLRPGDRLWFALQSDGRGRWQAWLWWGNRWNLLAAPALGIGPDAQIEQYVELHVDELSPAPVDVPPVAVDNVTLRAGASTIRPWDDTVDTLTGDDGPPAPGRLCVDWTTRYDTWRAGSCAR